MHHILPGLLFLAEQSPWSAGNIVTAIVGVVVAVAAFGGIAALLLYGLWAKTGGPLLQTAIKAWFNDKDQIATRRVETLEAVKAWYHDPETTYAKKVFIREQIDNEVHRTDGLIHSTVQEQLHNSIEPLREDLRDLKKLLSERAEYDTEFKRDVSERLAHIMGLLQQERHTPVGNPPATRSLTPARPDPLPKKLKEG